MIKEDYCKKENRDRRARELRAQGYRVRRYSLRNQLIHPEYIRDYEGYYETGFGNSYYRTPFSVVYCLEAE